MYQFTCLSFGLSSAPRVYTKVLCPIVGFFHSKGIPCVIYLDDLLLFAQRKKTLKEHAVTVLGILEGPHQLRKVLPGSSTRSDFPRLRDTLQTYGAQAPIGQASHNSERGQRHVETEIGVRSLPSSAYREDVGSFTGSSSCSTPLSQSPTPQTHSPEEEITRCINTSVSVCPERLNLVAREPLTMEQSTSLRPRTKSDHRDRCIKKRLGASSLGHNDRGMLESREEDVTHQRTGNDSCFFCNQSICEAQQIFYPGISQTGQTGCWRHRYFNALTTT